MVTVATAQDVGGHSGSERPVVLTFGVATAKYLSNDNDVLHVLYGVPLLRLDLEMGEDFHAYTSVEAAEENMLVLLKAYPHASYTDMDLQAHDTTWLAEQVKSQIERTIKNHPTGPLVQYENVKVIFIADWWFSLGAESLRQALVELFPQAAFYKAPLQGRATRVWNGNVTQQGSSLVRDASENPPICSTCGTAMRPAGSCFVCEGCGRTKGISSE